MMTFEHAQKTIWMAMIKPVFKDHEPETASDLLLKCGLPLRQISYGQFRNVLEVVGTPYVIKVPSPGRHHKVNVEHAVERVQCVEGHETEGQIQGHPRVSALLSLL